MLNFDGVKLFAATVQNKLCLSLLLPPPTVFKNKVMSRNLHVGI